MAATVEGAFTIVDRVSAKLDRIRERANRTDRAIESLGRRLDLLSSEDRVRRLDGVNRSVEEIGTTSTRAARGSDRLTQSFRANERAASGLKQRLGETAAAARGLLTVLAPAKFAAIGVAVGVAVQGVNALAAGVVSLTPNVVDLTAALAAVPATVVGIGLAVASAKLAFADLGKAMGGNKDALKGLTPEARQLADTLKGMQPIVKDLRQQAQQGLFPGIDASLTNLQRGVPMMGRLLRSAGRELGQFAERFTAAFTTRGRLADLEGIGGQGIRIFDRMGRGAQNLAEAVTDLAVAAEPFTDWLTKVIYGWTRYAKEAAAAGRETGSLSTFFARGRTSLEQFGRIASNLWHILGDIGAAARPLGNELYDAFERATGRWRTFTESLEGRNAMAKYFRDARAPLFQFFGLIGDLGKAIATFDASGLTETIRTLRELTPDIQRSLEALAGFGPTLARALAAVGRVLADMIDGAGPVTMIVNAFTNLLTIIDEVIDRIPAFGAILSAGVTMAAFAKLQSAIVGIARSWGLVASAANGATVAQRNAAVAGAAGGAGGPGGAAVVAGRGLFSRTGTYSAARQLGMSRTAAIGESLAARTGAGVLSSTAVAGAGGVGAGLLMGGRAALAGLSKVLLPLTAVGGIIGALQGTGGRGVRGLGQNILSGLTFGLTPSTAKSQERADQRAQREIDRRANAINAGVGGIRRGDQYLTAQSQLSYLRDQLRQNSGGDRASRETREVIRQEIKARRDLLPQLRAERYARRERGGENFASRARSALRYDTRRQGPQRGLRNYVSDTLGQLTGQDPNDPRARIIANTALEQAKAAAKGNPALLREYERLRRGVAEKFTAMGAKAKVVNNAVLTSTKEDWARISRSLTDPLERARQRNQRTWTSIQRDAYHAMQLQGLSPRRAQQEIRDAERNRRPVRSAEQVQASDAKRQIRGVPNMLRPPALQRGAGAATNGIFKNPLEAFAKPLSPQQLAKANASAGQVVKAATTSQKKISDAAKVARTDVEKATARQGAAAVASNQMVQRSAEQRWPAISKAITGNARGAQREASAAFGALTQNAFGQLKQMGYDQQEARKLLAPPRARGGEKKGATGMRVGAGGMRIGGAGLQDTVRVAPGHLAAPGELIVNRHTEQRIRNTYGVDLGHEVAGESRPHSAPMQRFAKGGRAGGAARGINLMGASPSLAKYARDAAGYGLVVSSGARPGAITSSGNVSNHSRGLAIDLAGPAAAMMAYARHAAKAYGAQLEELIYSPLGFGIKNGKRVPPYAVADHFDHVHVADTNASGGIAMGAGVGGAGGELMKALRARRSRYRGVPGALSTAAGRGGAAGISKLVNDRIRRAAAASPDADMGGGSMPSFGSADWNTELGKIAAAKNWNAADWRWIVQHESSGDPNAVNKSSGASGLGQMLGGNIAKYNGRGNPIEQIQGMGRYIEDRYRNPTAARRFWEAHNWYDHGGRVGGDFAGWFRNGGEVTASKPTLIGIGDGRKETATIRGASPAPAAAGRAFGREVVIERMVIENHREGDIKRHVKREVAEAFDELTAELAGQPMENETGVL